MAYEEKQEEEEEKKQVGLKGEQKCGRTEEDGEEKKEVRWGRRR